MFLFLFQRVQTLPDIIPDRVDVEAERTFVHGHGLYQPRLKASKKVAI